MTATQCSVLPREAASLLRCTCCGTVFFADLEHSRARVGSKGPGQEPSPRFILTFNPQNHLFQGGFDETRTRDLCHAKAGAWVHSFHRRSKTPANSEIV